MRQDKARGNARRRGRSARGIAELVDERLLTVVAVVFDIGVVRTVALLILVELLAMRMRRSVSRRRKHIEHRVRIDRTARARRAVGVVTDHLAVLADLHALVAQQLPEQLIGHADALRRQLLGKLSVEHLHVLIAGLAVEQAVGRRRVLHALEHHLDKRRVELLRGELRAGDRRVLHLRAQRIEAVRVEREPVRNIG